ncbi:hypothetical protein [Gordonia sp. YY1]|uniref:hypothetical protein n=1 Tax=Gordonia sp. YY1 TaxID=396712 RepID=UPI001331B332|nr:hypothetical protein [Gordonia sp. YY1]KAF0967266.1 hypothetical protein BPODLACK_04236 [Gordonia sp. YY1]
MSTDYRPLITNLHRGVHCDVRSARARLHSVIELLDRAHLPAVAADLRAVEQRLVDQADR